jgi:hypothetical protein
MPDRRRKEATGLPAKNERQDNRFLFPENGQVTGAPIAGSVFSLDG